MPLKLVLYPDPILRKRAAPVERIDQELRDRVAEMFEVMYNEGGIGLAAPQVSWSHRLFVLNIEADPEEGEEKVYINPQIVSEEGEVTEEEGCLSIPEIRADVTRSESVKVRAQGLDGAWFTEEADDLLARAIQHENDHLDGILFIHRVKATDKLLIKKDLKKLEQEARERSQTSRR